MGRWQQTTGTDTVGFHTDRAEARVFLLDDDASVVTATHYLLEAHDLAVVSFTCPFEFMRALRAEPSPGCLLLDLSMPQMSGLSVQEELSRIAPYLHILIMTGRATYANCAQAMRLGAVDIVEKPIVAQTFVPMVSDFVRASAEKWERYQKSQEFCEYYASLTDREVDAYQLLVSGDQTKQIAFKLGITVSTAEKHVRNVLRKFHVDSPARLILFSIEHGDLVEPRRADHAFKGLPSH